MFFVAGGELSHPPADHLIETRLTFEGGVDLQKPVIRRHSCVIEQDFDRAATLIERLEQVPAVFVRVQGLHWVSGQCTSTGRLKQKVLPPPALLSTQIRPP